MNAKGSRGRRSGTRRRGATTGFGDEDADGDGSGREATEKDDDLLLRL